MTANNTQIQEEEKITAIDFIKSSQKEAESETQDPLCCCEYIDREQQRYHILECCCHCESFDLVFTRLITCKKADPRHQRNMLLTFQDRLRIPWGGGAKRISLDTLTPIFVIPLGICLAAKSEFFATTIFLLGSIFMGYAYRHYQSTCRRTRFFFMWLVWSIIYMVILFEFTVPLLELLPEENLILVLLATASIFCLWRTKQRAYLNHVLQNNVDKDELPHITEASYAQEEEAAAAQHTALLLEHEGTADGGRYQPNICSSCRKYVLPRTSHCAACGACIMRRDHHSFWLDCCIGEYNHSVYLAGLMLAEVALLLGANLTLTAVCHPFLVVRVLSVPVMMPDDCSEVFFDFELGVSFIIALYALVMAGYIFIILMRQFYLISRGITVDECQRGQNGNRKTFWTNWKEFLF